MHMGQISDLAERHLETGRQLSFFLGLFKKSLFLFKRSLLSNFQFILIFVLLLERERRPRVKVGRAHFQKEAFSSKIPNV